jgi:hypothetical protein
MLKIRLSSTILLFCTLFVILKLFGIISWSWIWVLSPIWVPFTLLFVAYWVIVIFGYLLMSDLNKHITDEIFKEEDDKLY